MPAGFFNLTTDSKPRSPLSPRCGACGLHAGCKSPRMPVTGEGRRRVLVVAEAPGQTEDERNTQLVGKAGQRLRESIHRVAGWDLDYHCWKTNAVICHPGKGTTPTEAQVEACRPNLLRTIEELRPEVIVPLGGVAVDSLIAELWGREKPGPIGRWVGWQIPSQRLNAWVCPNWHPSYLLRANDRALDVWFDRYLAAALGLEGRPWAEVPDYAGQVEAILEPARAAAEIRGIVKKGGRVTFDYETNMLKPDHPDARIVCCSVCWDGERTIAFPWHGEAVTAMDELLLDPGIEKLGWNIKFEERWTVAALGHRVRNWGWDGMLASHVLDNRPGITGAKFQAFVRLGLGAYDAEVGPYLKAAGGGGNDANRVGEADLGRLLLYCGMDSLVEWKVAEVQRREMGIA